MATSALDLLTALDARLDDLEATTMVPGSIERVRLEWGALARAGLQLLHVRPRHPNDSARRLAALLESLAATPGEDPLPGPGTALMAVTATIGCAAEVLRIRTVTSLVARDLAGDAIRSSLEAALARAARWTQHGFLTSGEVPDARMVRLARIDAEPLRPLVLHSWRSIGPTDPGIDGAVSRWETAAAEAITSPRTVTQLALQLASADIALLCASTSAVLQRATGAGAIPDPAAGDALNTAGRSWSHAARWPGELRLGGRASELRHASAELRERLDNTLLTGGDWKEPGELFAERSFEQYIVVLHSGLQSAIRVGQQVLATLDDLTRGANRVWVDADHVPASVHAAQMALYGVRYNWQPDPAGFYSAETLHDRASRALTELAHATPLTIDALISQTLPPAQVGDEGPWETVSTPLDPLRAAQEQAKLAAIFPTGSPAPSISR